MELTTEKSRDERWRESWHQMNHRFLTFPRPNGIPGFLRQPRRCAAWVSLPNHLHSAVGECGTVGLQSPPQLVSRDQALPRKSLANPECGWNSGLATPAHRGSLLRSALWVSRDSLPRGLKSHLHDSASSQLAFLRCQIHIVPKTVFSLFSSFTGITSQYISYPLPLPASRRTHPTPFPGNSMSRYISLYILVS